MRKSGINSNTPNDFYLEQVLYSRILNMYIKGGSFQVAVRGTQPEGSLKIVADGTTEKRKWKFKLVN